jgi:hypothetical protein
MYSATNTLVKAITYQIPTRGKRAQYGTDKREYYREIYLKSDHWKQLKAKKLLANPLCERCGSNKFLDVHHLDYKNLYDVLLTDLETLCRHCHHEDHERAREEKRIEESKKVRHKKRSQSKNEPLYSDARQSPSYARTVKALDRWTKKHKRR